MAVPDKTIDPKILDCAKAEFLEKGYMNASLRQICANAGALYKRYSGKEALFNALVQDVIDDIEKVISDRHVDYSKGTMTDTQLYNMWTLTEMPPMIFSSIRTIPWRRLKEFFRRMAGSSEKWDTRNGWAPDCTGMCRATMR